MRSAAAAALVSCASRAHAVTLPVLEFDELLDSSDMGPGDWLNIATTIHTHYYDYDGFVVIHGTDTMAYPAFAPSNNAAFAQ